MQSTNLITQTKSRCYIFFLIHFWGYQEYKERIILDQEDCYVVLVWNEQVGIGWLQGLRQKENECMMKAISKKFYVKYEINLIK